MFMRNVSKYIPVPLIPWVLNDNTEQRTEGVNVSKMDLEHDGFQVRNLLSKGSIFKFRAMLVLMGVNMRLMMRNALDRKQIGIGNPQKVPRNQKTSRFNYFFDLGVC